MSVSVTPASWISIWTDNVDLSNISDNADINITVDNIDTTNANVTNGNVSVEFQDEAGDTVVQNKTSNVSEPILDITVVPGETETSNNFTFTFRADRLDNETSSIELLADFNETSNVDASDISEDEVTVTFDGVTKSIDSVQQDNEGELKIILGSDESSRCPMLTATSSSTLRTWMMRWTPVSSTVRSQSVMTPQKRSRVARTRTRLRTHLEQ
jgi:hypothetical protein